MRRPIPVDSREVARATGVGAALACWTIVHRRRWTVPPLLLAPVLTVVLTALTACSAPAAIGEPTAAATPSAPPSVDAVPPGLERFYAQSLSWGPCAPFATGDDDRAAFADRRYDCTKLEVPLDYTNPAGPTAQLGVLDRLILWLQG